MKKEKLAELDRHIQSLTEDAKQKRQDITARQQDLLQDKSRLKQEQESLISPSTDSAMLRQDFRSQ